MNDNDDDLRRIRCRVHRCQCLQPVLAPQTTMGLAIWMFGCTNSAACNFDEEALIDDGSCDFTSCGRVLSMARNYDSNAQYDDGLAPTFQKVLATGTATSSMPRVNVAETATATATKMGFVMLKFWAAQVNLRNYDPTATVNDGSCDFISCRSFGCTDAAACIRFHCPI